MRSILTCVLALLAISFGKSGAQSQVPATAPLMETRVNPMIEVGNDFRGQSDAGDQREEMQVPPILIRDTPTPDLPRSKPRCATPQPVGIALRENPDATLTEMVGAVHIRWALLSSIHHVDILPVQRSEEFDLPLLLVRWSSFQFNDTTLSFLWFDGEAWQAQTFCTATLELVEARLVKSRAHVEMGLIVNTCVNATATCEHVWLYELQSNLWRESWNSARAQKWPAAHVTVYFPEEGLDTILVRSSSWHTANASPVEEAKQRIFRESNAGPHRWFLHVWQRNRFAYVPVARFTESSAYNTLIEFLYAQKSGGNAVHWVTSPWLLHDVATLKLEELPNGLIPGLPEGEESIERGPIVVDTAQQTLIFHFTQRGGRHLIHNIESAESSEGGASGPPRPAATPVP